MKPLGRSRGFHRALANTASRDHTLQVTSETQDLLIDPPWCPKNVRRRVKMRKGSQEMVAANNAREAALFSGVPCRVRSGVLISEKTRLNFGDRSTNCPRERGEEATQPHPCDVLGPQACADCIKARQRRRGREESYNAFPGIQNNQRSLCWPRRVQPLVTPTRLPPLVAVARAADVRQGELPGRKLSQVDSGQKLRENPPLGIDYGEFGNIQLRTDYTTCIPETFSAVRRKRQAGAVSEPELHKRVMRRRQRRKQRPYMSSEAALGFSDHRMDTITPPPRQKTVTIILPTINMRKGFMTE